MKIVDIKLFEIRIKNGRCPICGHRVSTQDLTLAHRNKASKEVVFMGNRLIRICERHPNKDKEGNSILTPWMQGAKC